MFTSMATTTTTSCSLNRRLLGKDDDIFLFSSFLPRFSKAMSFRFFFFVVVSKGSDELYHQRAVKGVLESIVLQIFLSFFTQYLFSLLFEKQDYKRKSRNPPLLKFRVQARARTRWSHPRRRTVR